MKRYIAVILGMCLAASFAQANKIYYPAAEKRGGNWETTLQMRWQDSESLGGQYGTGVDIDSGWGLGFGIAYNFDAHWNIGFEFSNVGADYKATYLADVSGASLQTLSHELDHFSFQTNLTYHFLEGNFTPYVQANLGWSNIDSNIVSGYGYGSCWWDPWWGYVCGRSYSTYDEDGLSWGAGVGLRWDYLSNAFAKLGVNQQWVDIGKGFDDPSFVVTRLEFGWKF